MLCPRRHSRFDVDLLDLAEMEGHITRANLMPPVASPGPLSFEERARRAWREVFLEALHTLAQKVPDCKALLDQLCAQAHGHPILSVLWPEVRTVLEDFYLFVQALALRARASDSSHTPACVD